MIEKRNSEQHRKNAVQVFPYGNRRLICQAGAVRFGTIQHMQCHVLLQQFNLHATFDCPFVVFLEAVCVLCFSFFQISK